MKLATQDLTKLDEMLQVLETIYQHRLSRPTSHSDLVYYELLVKYYRGLRQAPEQGQPIAIYTCECPPEILNAFNLVPLQLETVAGTMMQTLKLHDAFYSAAKAYGLAPEICSVHRSKIAPLLLNLLPPADFVVWTSIYCDNATKSGENIAALCGCPAFFLERAYDGSERAVQYYASQLEDLIGFLEEHTGKQVNERKLRESVLLSYRMMELQEEINCLRLTKPSPIANRRSMQLGQIYWLYSGTHEGVAYFQAVRDEVKEMAQKRQGYLTQERYRVLTLGLTSAAEMKILDFMGRDYGAAIVMEPWPSRWGKWEFDPSRPLEALAQRAYINPMAKLMVHPIEKAIEDIAQEAIDYEAEGVIFWNHVACANGCATIRLMKDILARRAGVPLLTLDCDPTDPSVTPETEIREKLESFFELLLERKGTPLSDTDTQGGL